jgi:hypothetical protein
LPPISDTGGSQARWMTLVEALEYIQSVENCDRVVAQVHLKHGIGRSVIAAKWADSSRPKDKPDVTKLLRSQLVLSGPGLAPFDLSLRSLLVLRQAVYAMWPPTTGKGPAAPDVVSTVRHNLAQWAAEEEHEQWMSLVEAIEHIQIAQHCDSIEALSQLKRELRDGMVQAEWEDSKEPKDRPDLEFLQASQLVLFGTGSAPDNVQAIYRPLVVERSAVCKLWPLPNHWHKGSRQTAQPAEQRRPQASEA